MDILAVLMAAQSLMLAILALLWKIDRIEVKPTTLITISILTTITIFVCTYIENN